MNITLVVGSAAVLASFFAIWWAVSGARPARATVGLGVARRSSTHDLRVATLEHGVAERAVQPLLATIGRLARRYTPRGRISGLEQRLLLAGIPRGWTIERVLAAKALCAMVVAGLGLLYFLLSPGLLGILVAVGGGVLGFFVPDALLAGKADDRQKLIERSLAETMDQLTVAVQAGLGLDAAIARVAVTTEGPLSVEFARASQDIRAGQRRSDALVAMADRVGLQDLRQVVIALAQAEKLGVPVAKTMRVQAAELRTKRRQHAEEKAMKLPIKILFPTVLCILPCLFIVLMGPAAMNIYETLGSG